MWVDGLMDMTQVAGASRNFCEKRLEEPLGEVYFKSRNYPLNSRCDLNAQLLDDEADGTDNHYRTKRSCRLWKTYLPVKEICLNVQSDCSNSYNL